MAPRTTSKARRASLRRDAAIERLRRSTTWVSAAAIALIGVFSAAVATALPGHSRSSPAPANVQSQSGASPATATIPPSSSGAASQLQPPTAPPTTAPPVTAPPVVSGAS